MRWSSWGEWGALFPWVLGFFAHNRQLLGAGSEMLCMLFATWEGELGFQPLLCVRMKPFSADAHLDMGWNQTFVLLHIII